MDIKEFNSLMALTDKNIMFRVENGKLLILGDDRKALFPSGYAVKSEVVFARASKSMVAELLSTSKDMQIIIEKRENCTSISYGENILENLFDCPPICW